MSDFSGQVETGLHGPWELVHESVGGDPGECPSTGDFAPRVARLPPQDLQAERCVLGSCLLLLSALDDVLELLIPEHFYSDSHRVIFTGLRDMRNAGRTDIDPVTLASYLQTRGALEKAGGPAEIIACIESVPHAAHAVSYAQDVLDAARRRGAEGAATDILRQTPRKDIPTDEILSDAEEAIHSVMEDALADQPQEIGAVLSEAIEEIQHGQPSAKTVSTGWQSLDQVIGGVPCGGLVILAGRPSMGKSACALSLALSVAKTGAGVLYSSYEQTRLEMAERLLAIQSKLPHKQMVRGQLTDAERNRAMAAAGELSALPIVLDTSCRNLTGLSTLIRLQARRKDVRVAFVDYLQLVPPDDYRLPREQQVAQVSRRLKILAMQTGVAVVCLSQLNRDVEKREDKRPKLSDLRESGAIEQDADHVWFIHRPNYFAANTESEGFDNVGVLQISKQRNGPLGDVSLHWFAERMEYAVNDGFSVDVTPSFASDTGGSQGSLFG